MDTERIIKNIKNVVISVVLWGLALAPMAILVFSFIEGRKTGMVLNTVGQWITLGLILIPVSVFGLICGFYALCSTVFTVTNIREYYRK